ncbi:MAG: BREX system P-loop protein BrxC [Geobacter sp.]|nr:BREX system P-loop protein BrxC [Geobacter sp.]
MNIHEVLMRDPAENALANQGQARIADLTDEKTIRELQFELSTFVCEGQYADGLQRVIRSYLENQSRTSQKGSWISGFYGSGKSHFLKMLCHLWQDTEFPDGSTARSLVPVIPEDLKALLWELDTAGKRGGGLLAASGAMPSGTMDDVRITILKFIFRAVGLPAEYAPAMFCLWLHSQGYYDSVKATVQAAGKEFEKELRNLYVSGTLAQAVMKCDPNFATSEAEAKQAFRSQFPKPLSDITTDEFLHACKDALKLVGSNGRTPCTLLVLDEVQAYIGTSNERSVIVTEVAEAVSKQFDSQVIIVGAGQSALTDVQLLHKLMDRFTIPVQLSDAEVETVTRKVLLQKKPTAVPEVKSVMDANAGEVSRQLQGTKIGESAEDRDIIVDDYPLLPVRRRFWEHCFRQIDSAGTHSQLRSQLRIIHDAVAKIAKKPLGSVVPADELYDALAPEMLNTGVLLWEISERIIQVGKNEGALAQRICGLVFLIGKLKREAGADIGVRANKDHIADLMVDDLTADNGKLRSDVEAVLIRLADQGILMPVGDEYRLQTREGVDWDREFRNRQTKLTNDESAIQFRRDQLLYAETDKIIRSVKLVQGLAKETRQLAVHRDQTPPIPDGVTIPVWVRDGWSCAEKDVLEAARTAGADSPVVYVFIARKDAEDLRRTIVETDAAQQTLDAKGNPTTDEGREARQSMESRRLKAAADRNRLVRDIVANATKVFQGGGSELLHLTLDERVKNAALDALVRMFPRFKDADSNAWETVIKRARDGADLPLQPTGHTDATEKHPVCQQVLSTIGAGKTGTDIRKTLSGSPFGWPRDAVDAALIALHRSQHVTALLNGVPIPLGQIDQNKIPKAEFRVEKTTLSVQDRLLLRKLFTQLAIPFKAGEEAAKAPEFLTTLLSLGRSAGGAAPLPAAPAVTDIGDIQRLVGNEQLVAIKDKAADFEAKIKDWKAISELVTQRKPVWDNVVSLSTHAQGLAGAESHLDQIAAIRDQRLLLEPSDPVAPIRLAVAGLLRDAVNTIVTEYGTALDAGLKSLDANDLWQKLNPADRETIKTAVGLVPLTKHDIASDESLLAHLSTKSLDATRTEIDAISGRIQQAIERAAKILEPKVQHITLERTTLRNESDVNGWLERQREKLTEAVKQGPVLIN